jgi:hypothetical protein
MVYWQSVLLDVRTDRAGLRWPGSWQPGRDYLHRTGPVGQRHRRGVEYLTNDTVYVDMTKMITFRPENRQSPMGGRPCNVVKRLYPLDPQNRAFALSIAFRLAGVAPEFVVDSRKPTRSPDAIVPLYFPDSDEVLELKCSASYFGQWCADLNMRVRGVNELVPLRDVGERIAGHLTAVTGGTRDGQGVRVIGHSLYLRASLIGESGVADPDLVVDQPPEVAGRPFVAVAGRQSPASLERRLRTFALRTFAEVQMANYLYGVLGRDAEQMGGWIGSRAATAVEYLSRPTPHGYDGEIARKVWQLSVSRRGQSFGRLKATARDRLATMIGPRTNQDSPGNVTFVTQNFGDSYNVGQAGAVGPNSQGNLVNVGGTRFDLGKLGAELTQLSQSLRAEHPDDADILEEAAQDAANGDAQAVEGKLKRLSRRVAQFALDLGLAIAGAAIAHAGGLA